MIINILANIIQIDNFKHKSSANTLNNNRIERFYNYNKQSPKNQFCPSFVPQTLEGRIFLSLGHFGGQKCLFLRLKVVKYKHLQIWISKKARSKPNVFVFSMVLFAKSLSPDNIFWKYCPTSIPNTHKMVIDNDFKSDFWGYSEMISEKLP